MARADDISSHQKNQYCRKLTEISRNEEQVDPSRMIPEYFQTFRRFEFASLHNFLRSKFIRNKLT